jgi:transcriptional regulator with XRE-family HTH domain
MFKQRLKELRKKYGVTQEQLAAIIGVERSTIGKYEGSKGVIPSTEVLNDIADYFEVSVDYLLGRTDDPYPYDSFDEYIPEHFNGDLKQYLAYLKARDEDVEQEYSAPEKLSPLSKRMDRIRELREENGWSQEELADKLAIAQQTVSAYERGLRDPDTSTLGKMADLFDVSTDYLLGRTDVRNPIITIAAHADEDLPPEAQERIREYAEMMRQKYMGDKKGK